MATTYDAWYYTDGSAINGLDDPYEIGEVAWNACEALNPSPNTVSAKSCDYCSEPDDALGSICKKCLQRFMERSA